MIVFFQAFHGFSPGFWVFVLVFSGALLLWAMLWPDPWVAGGDGWLMLLRGREPRAWVRTGRLVDIRLEPKYAGEGDWEPYLTLRDNEGRELRTWLSKLPAEAVPSLLAGIGQSAEDSLADLSSATAQALLTALDELAGTGLPGARPAEPG